MKKILFGFTIFAVFLCVAAPSAQALMFKDLAWGDYITGDYYKSFAVSDNGSNYDINFLSLGGFLTWNEDDGGVGIGDDEITGGREALLIWFSKPLYISTFELVDLFNESTQETGHYFYDADFGSAPFLDGGGVFQAMLDQTPGGEGYFSLDLHDQVQGIAFFAGFNSQNDYAVAGYSTPVPEPSTVLMLGIGMIGLAGLGRRKFRKE